MRFIPNERRPGMPDRDIDDDCCFDLTDDSTILIEMSWFADAYRAELRKLAVAYGQAPQIKWGLIRYSN